MDLLDSFDAMQLFPDQHAVFIEIADLDAQDEVAVPRDHVAGKNLGHLGDSLQKDRGHLGGVVFEGDLDKGGDRIAEQFVIELHGELLDDALLAEPLHAAQAGAGSESDLVGKGVVGDVGALLEQAQDAAVDLVQFDGLFHGAMIAEVLRRIQIFIARMKDPGLVFAIAHRYRENNIALSPPCEVLFPMARMTIGDYLLTRLREAGIGHLIGVPGDFNLAFLEQVLAHEGMEWVGACNELNAAYAADGYARMRGAGALLVTYGVGDLSALNGIAGAHAEHVPVICISGVPPLDAIRNRHVLHHTSGTGGFEDVMNCMAQFTAAQARITPGNAAIEIDRLVRTTLREKQPVYLQLPSDISYLEIEGPAGLLDSYTPTGDAVQTGRVVELLAERIAKARRPALLVDADAHRFGLRPLICALGERCNLPFASMASGRSIFNEQHPLYRGIYGGKASSAETLETIEGSDCLIAIGVRFFDATTCFFSHRIPSAHTIVLDSFYASLDGRTFEGVTAKEVLAGLLERLPESGSSHSAGNAGPSTALSANSAPNSAQRLPESGSSHSAGNAGPSTALCANSAPNSAQDDKFFGRDGKACEKKLTHARLWPRIAGFLREGDVILAESGTSQSGLSGVRLPARTTFVSQTTWGSIGYTLAALLGSLLAEPARRQLLFIGDGSLQMTAQEISTMLRHDFKPILFVINNFGYTIERVILGPHSAYNEIQNWSYTQLPAVLADGRKVASYRVSTEEELDRALEEIESNNRFTLVELVMEKLDAPAGLRRMGPMIAEYDFGERGPQAALDSKLK